jgi:hypothetical protein
MTKDTLEHVSFQSGRKYSNIELLLKLWRVSVISMLVFT